jgi:hypothetical protein
MFDSIFHLKQLIRYAKNFAHDPLHLRSQEIIEEQISLMQEVYGKTFNTVFRHELYPEATANATLKPACRYDLIISSLSLHYVNNIEQEIKNLHTQLNQGGVLVGTFFGGNTLTELRRALEQAETQIRGGVSPRIIPMIDVKDAARLLKNSGFNNVTSTLERVEIVYQNFHDMLHHPKIIGQANSLANRDSKFFARSIFNCAQSQMSEHVSTFDIITVTGTAP